MTLMACYGLPPCKEAVDNDHDGFSVCLDGGRLDAPADCNDSNPSIHPNAADPVGDGIDQDCDGVDGTRSKNPLVASASGSTSASSPTASPSSSITPSPDRSNGASVHGPSGALSGAPSPKKTN